MTPPVVEASLKTIQAARRTGRFVVHYSCDDDGPDAPTVGADIAGVPVADGQEVRVVKRPGRLKWEPLPDGRLLILAEDPVLTVTCADGAGNTTAEVVPVPFRRFRIAPGF